MSRVEVVLVPAEQSSRFRSVVRPVGSRARVSKSEEPVRSKVEVRRSVQKAREVAKDATSDGSCSSDSSSSYSVSSVKTGELRSRLRRKDGVDNAMPDRVSKEGTELCVRPPLELIKRRCAWVTPNSDQVYVSFHDEEWGMPIHEDSKLFEMLIYSQALAELNWTVILNHRYAFRELFENFNPASVAKYSEKKILSLKSSGRTLISEIKLRAAVDNAKQFVKVIEEFGSFEKYCWGFVNHKPILNRFRYPRQVPARSPKAEVINTRNALNSIPDAANSVLCSRLSRIIAVYAIREIKIAEDDMLNCYASTLWM